ncbi:MAG TPA: hypothetical protein VKS03_02165 [Thermoanaerobaculia bacterium]|nr:hypothetical protein [Thermoanaerobaculia bacterium]
MSMWHPLQKFRLVFGSTVEDWVLNVLLAAAIVLASVGVRQCSADQHNRGPVAHVQPCR